MTRAPNVGSAGAARANGDRHHVGAALKSCCAIVRVTPKWCLSRTQPIEAAARFWPGVHRAALIGTSSGPALASEGNVAHRSAWTQAAAALGEIRIAVLDTIPLDRRHRSKVDYRALAKAVAQRKL
jgi:hypothetical protein